MNKSKKPLLTVLTPTYNRAKKLKELYESLKKQNSNNFVWIIIDDGSTDKTKEQVSNFINDNKKFKIEYLYKENGGKHTAINSALSLLDTPLTIIIDSDDKMLPDGIKNIEYYWNKYKNMNLNTLTFEHLYNNGKPMAKIKVGGVLESRILYPVKNKELGDYSDVFITSQLVKFPLPVFEGEKFLNEGPLYFKTSENKKSVFINIPLTIGSYRDDGLTKNVRKLQIINYKGAMYNAFLSMSKIYPLWFRFKNAILYDYLAIKNKLPIFKVIKESEHLLLTGASVLLAYIYIIFRKMKKVENERTK